MQKGRRSSPCCIHKPRRALLHSKADCRGYQPYLRLFYSWLLGTVIGTDSEQANSRENERAVRMYGYFRFIYTRLLRARCLLYTGNFGRVFSNHYKEQMKDTLFLPDISDSFSELYIDKTFAILSLRTFRTCIYLRMWGKGMQ